ncbi:molybdopterin-dependent oxidoreductase [Enterobacter cloacae subsp. cloacae]|nr:molybdopterin-dependent oxidoreductase [Enterobacter cloacae subsp. cloacae]
MKNGSNIALLNAMGHVIIEENLYDRRLSPPVRKVLKSIGKLSKAIRQNLSKRSPASARRRSVRAARMYAGAKTAAILWGMGVTQFYQGVETVRS